MVTAAIGALVGWAFSGGLIAAGIVTTAFGAIALGASLGSLFASHDSMDLSSSPNYSFGPISNTMSQLVPIYVIYGKCRVAGNIIYQAFNNDKKEVQDLYILVGEGGVNAITGVMANDQNPAELEGCSVTTYTDTTAATHDSRDPSGARPYPDNVALICLTLKAQENLNGTPTITSIVEGMKVWTPNGFAYSRNPIWIILDILCHPRYGMGMGAVDSTGAYTHPNWDKIDYACALAAANYCDGTVEYGPRFQLDFVMDSSRPIRDVLTDFLAVCRGYIVQTNKLEIYIDAPVSTYSRSITPGNITENSFTFWQAADEDVCNRITVDWVDPDNNYERVTDVFQDSDDIAIRGVVEKSVSLLGVTRSGQVGHMGYYLLKSSMLVRNFCSFGVSFKDCDIQPGEVLTVSFEDFTGWVNKPFRVLSVKDNGNDVMTVTCSEYIPEIYDDSVMEVPVHIDTSLTTNYKPDDVEDLTITEQLETLQDGSYNLIAKITWTPPESYQTLELWYRYSSEVAWVAGGTLPKGSTEYYLPCTGNIGDTLYVRVYTVSRLGVRSAGQTTSRILHGDTVPPAVPTNLQGLGGFRCAMITWIDPPDGDLDHIDVYRSLTADDADDFEKIGISPRFSQEYVDSNLYVLQTAWYKLKAVDVAKNESEFSAVISVTSEALPAQQIPEQSIQPSKLVPQLERLVSEMRTLAEANLTNSINEEENRTTAAIAIQELSTEVVEGLLAEAEARTLLAAQLNGSIATLQQLMQVVARSVTISQQATAPDNPQIGDIWEYATGQYRQWDGAAWQSITDEEMQATIEAVTATYSLLLDVNGNVAGIGITNSNIGGSEFAILADAFKIATSSGDKTTIFQIDAEGNVQLVGDLIAGGSITGDKINAAAQIQLGAGGQLIMGNGSIFQMGSGAIIIDSELGVLQIRDPNNLTTGNYIRVETGDITTYQYIAGAYRAMKSLRKMEVGVGSNGATVTLPGYWPSQPKIQVSPNALQCYNASYPNQSQQLRCYADAITYNNGVVTFVPRAYLEIAAGNQLVSLPVPVLNKGIGEWGNAEGTYIKTPATITTSTYTSIPSGAKNIVIKAKVYAQDCNSYHHVSGAGDNYWYTTFVSVKVTVTVYVGSQSIVLGSKTFAPAASNISQEPTSLYQELTYTLPSGSGNVYLSAYVEVPSGFATRDFGDLTIKDYSRVWLRLDSLQWSLSGSTQLATGTLNYVAIAE